MRHPIGPLPTRRRTPAARPGFTLVELLVVVGIIALLIGVLLPALSAARATANRTKCLSNLQQIGLALVMYTNDNHGYFPFAARYDASANLQRLEDYVYWQQPSTFWNRGLPINAGHSTPAQDLNLGTLVRYMGNQFNPAVWTCPADDPNTHPIDFSTLRYPYSYTMNTLLSSDLSVVAQIKAAGGNVNGQIQTTYLRYLGGLTKIARVRHSYDCVMALEETPYTINDGNSTLATPQSATNIAPGPDYLSMLHDGQAKRPDRTGGTLAGRDQADGFYNSQGRGNVVFVDGHGGYVTREFVHLPSLHHWDPSW